MFKVFVINLDTEEMHEAKFGSEEYFTGISFLVNDENFDDHMNSMSYGYKNDYLRYIIAESEKEAWELYTLFSGPDSPVGIDQKESELLSAFYSDDSDLFVEKMSELGDNYKVTLITMPDGSRHLNIEEICNPSDNEDIK